MCPFLCEHRQRFAIHDDFFNSFAKSELYTHFFSDFSHADWYGTKSPVGWKMPYSYSRNARMVNRLGQLNGDIPRYLVWNDIASISRSSSNKRIKSLATDRVGRKTVAARMARLEKMSVGPFHGSCKQALARWSFLRLSSTYEQRHLRPFRQKVRRFGRMTSRSLVQSSSPPCPKISR